MSTSYIPLPTHDTSSPVSRGQTQAKRQRIQPRSFCRPRFSWSCLILSVFPLHPHSSPNAQSQSTLLLHPFSIFDRKTTSPCRKLRSLLRCSSTRNSWVYNPLSSLHRGSNSRWSTIIASCRCSDKPRSKLSLTIMTTRANTLEQTGSYKYRRAVPHHWSQSTSGNNGNLPSRVLLVRKARLSRLSWRLCRSRR